MELEVGQKLWYVPRATRLGKPEHVSITKIGRKWAYIGGRRNTRVDIETLIVDGGDFSSPGRCYLSEAYYEDSVVCQSAWDKLRNSMSYRVPMNLTLGEIATIQKLVEGETDGKSRR